MDMQYLKSSSPKTGVVLIELNRPEKRNALNNATLQELADYLTTLDKDREVRAVVITGHSQCFAAGADLNELAQLDVVSIQQDQRPQLWKRIDEFSKPLIMAVNGYALGAGFELALPPAASTSPSSALAKAATNGLSDFPEKIFSAPR